MPVFAGITGPLHGGALPALAVRNLSLDLSYKVYSLPAYFSLNWSQRSIKAWVVLGIGTR